MKIFVDGQEVTTLPRYYKFTEKYQRLISLIKRYRFDPCLSRFYNRAYHGLINK